MYKMHTNNKICTTYIIRNKQYITDNYIIKTLLCVVDNEPCRFLYVLEF